MTTIRETCSCGAKVEVEGGHGDVHQHIESWRTNHRHEMAQPTATPAAAPKPTPPKDRPPTVGAVGTFATVGFNSRRRGTMGDVK